MHRHHGNLAAPCEIYGVPFVLTLSHNTNLFLMLDGVFPRDLSVKCMYVLFSLHAVYVKFCM